MTFSRGFRRQAAVAAVLLLAFALSACGLSLAEDVTPPPNYRPPAQQQGAQPVEVKSTVFPLVPPDPAQGEAIYTEKCMPCHGVTGLGDGPQADKLSNPAAPIGRPELARSARPVDWFNIVTVGNLDRLMPGFSGSLNDRQRWDVVAYTFTLNTSADELERGRAVYELECAACHGISGRGDGPRAGEFNPPPANWTNQERLSGLSADDMVLVIIGMDDSHPKLTAEFDTASAYAAASYVRSLGFAGRSQQIAAQVSETEASGTEGANTEGTGGTAGESGSGVEAGAGNESADQLIETLAITGRVTNATPGGTVPQNLQVNLTAFQGMSPAFEVDAPVAADGSYTFENVDYNPDYVYFVRVLANGLIFNSDILHGRDVVTSQADLPVAIFDTTSELSDLRADRLHIFFDFNRPGYVQVVSLFIISNPGDKVVVPATEDGPVMTYDLPEGATNLQFQDGELGGRYIEVPGGFGDRMTIAPGIGQHQLLFAFEMPYSRKLDFDLRSPVPVDAAIVMVPPAGVRLKSDKLVDSGERSVQGMSFQMYQASTTLAAGEAIPVSLSGSAGETTSASTEDAMTLLLVGVGFFGAVLAGAGYWLYRQRQTLTPVAAGAGDADVELEESSEAILETIVTLDDQHAAGSLPDTVYFERRAELKARLAEALAREENGA
jgi:mono/diheme cytochrome c family protein